MSPHFELDDRGRTVCASAIITPASVVPHKRARINHIIPWGYKPIRDGAIYVLHRTHLIGDQLLPVGLSAVKENIITGTFDLNVMRMLPIENRVRQFVKTSQMSVEYSVTPLYAGDNMLPYAIRIVAVSTAPHSLFTIDIVLPNTQSGYIIDYQSGSIHHLKNL